MSGYYDDEDEFGDDLQEEDGFGEEDGFSELDLEEDSGETAEEEDFGAEFASEPAPATPEAEPESKEPTLEELLESAGLGSGAQDDLAWRETYCVLFTRQQRPTLTQVEAAIGNSGRRLTMEHLQADDDGLFLSVLVQAPEDNAALEVSYEDGEAVMEQSAELAKRMQNVLDGEQLAQLLRADARLDIMHFERMDESTPPDAAMPDDIGLEALNPATLISVVEALSTLTGGLPIDPAAGDVMI